MPGVTPPSLDELLRRCGLVPLGTVEGGGLPSPEWAWHVTAGVRAPSAAVPLVGGELAARVDAEWLRLARRHGVVDDQDTFLVSLSRSRPWTAVRLTDGFRLAEYLAGDGAPASQAEFITMARDGSALCGVTTEEYDVWVVADTELLHASPPPPPAPAEVDPASLSPMQLNRIFAPDRLRPPYRDGWVLLGFHRGARRLVRLHELPESVTDEAVRALVGVDALPGAGPLPLTDDQARAVAGEIGVPVTADRLTYLLEYQTGPVKSRQSTSRSLDG